jgi:hypothetical protein
MKQNPKAVQGRKKPRISAIPPQFILAMGHVMQHGADKYGKYNWRETPIDTVDYVDALGRHFLAWWGGEDLDPDSGESHLVHLAACASVVWDAIQHDSFTDNRLTQEEIRDE